MKAPGSPVKEVEKKTWVEKVTDDSNHWFLARSLERDGLYKEASYQYLQDASHERQRNILRAALSTVYAGRCLAAAGETRMAVQLYLEAGRLYKQVLSSTGCDHPNMAWLSRMISYCRSKAEPPEGEEPAAAEMSGELL